MKMNVLYRMWWRMLMDARPMIRFLAERFPKLAPWGVFWRMLAHVVVGNPLQYLAAVVGVVAWSSGFQFRLVAIAVVTVVGLLEVWSRWGFESGRGGRLSVGWREAWRLHRRWPSEWARAAAKTVLVQAEVGTSKEPVASARLRPIADHPKMGWWPSISWPQVSWWVGPPPGRSFESFAKVLDVLAANYSRCLKIELEYDMPTDSYARLVVSFRSILETPVEPEITDVDSKPWTPAGPDLDGDVGPVIDIEFVETTSDEDRTVIYPERWDTEPKAIPPSESSGSWNNNRRSNGAA